MPEFRFHAICEVFKHAEFRFHVIICEVFDHAGILHASMLFARFSSMRNSASMQFAKFPRKLRASPAHYICTTKVDFPTRTIPAEGARVRSKICETHSGSAPTRTIPAEGARARFKMCENAQRERSDTHDLRRGCTRKIQNARKRTAGALRHARSPQRVRQATQEYAKTHSGSAPTRTIPAEGCIALDAAKPTPA